MKVRISHDDHIRSSQQRDEEIERLVDEHLGRFGEVITSVQVHLSDENGPRVTQGDRRCLMEARVAGREPIVASYRADTVRQAVSGAASRLERAIDQSRDRRRDARRQRARSVKPMPTRALVVARS
jgi:ribosome-associated translation inhibitor RaiA